MVVELAVTGEGGLDLALQPALALRIREPLVAFGGVGIRLRAVDAEQRIAGDAIEKIVRGSL